MQMRWWFQILWLHGFWVKQMEMWWQVQGFAINIIYLDLHDFYNLKRTTALQQLPGGIFSCFSAASRMMTTMIMMIIYEVFCCWRLFFDAAAISASLCFSLVLLDYFLLLLLWFFFLFSLFVCVFVLDDSATPLTEMFFYHSQWNENNGLLFSCEKWKLYTLFFVSLLDGFFSVAIQFFFLLQSNLLRWKLLHIYKKKNTLSHKLLMTFHRNADRWCSGTFGGVAWHTSNTPWFWLWLKCAFHCATESAKTRNCFESIFTNACTHILIQGWIFASHANLSAIAFSNIRITNKPILTNVRIIYRAKKLLKRWRIDAAFRKQKKRSFAKHSPQSRTKLTTHTRRLWHILDFDTSIENAHPSARVCLFLNKTAKL